MGKRKIFTLGVFLLFCIALQGQSLSTQDSIINRLFVEAKWRYTYTLHLESNTIIHQAESFYEYYLYFRYDYTYQQYLNGTFDRGSWSLSDRDLFYSFKHIPKFQIVKVTKTILVLEFQQPNSKGTYQYHFVRVDSKDAPFRKPVNELPDVIIEEKQESKFNEWLAFGKKKRKRRKSRRRSKKNQEEEKYISIELIGGGYYGGVDPVLRDYIQIKSSGRLIKEYKSQNNGLVITKKDIPREELERLAEFIVAKDFFEFNQVYDCANSLCQKRKYDKPTPIPLRLAVAYGNRRKIVTISIWGNDGRYSKYVDYPPALDQIIQGIQKMAHNLDG